MTINRIISNTTRHIVASVVAQHILQAMTYDNKLVQFVEKDQHSYLLIIQDSRITWNERGEFAEEIQDIARKRQFCHISTNEQLPMNIWVFDVVFTDTPAQSALLKIRAMIVSFLEIAVL